MIDFRIKTTGVILDIAPDALFQIEYDNPMFSDDRCPVAFSTEISFLPTPKNKEQLGYLAAMMLLPSVKELDVEVYASGIKILDGMLKFSSIHEGLLNYTFVGRGIEDSWGGKIFEKQIFSVPGDSGELHSVITAIQAGEVDGIYAPLLVNSSEADKITIFHESQEYHYSDCTVGVKYHNYPAIGGNVTEESPLTPAISVLTILGSELANVDADDMALVDLLARIVILGQYKTDFGSTPTGIPAEGLELARSLPDITALDLFRIVLKMVCCAFFRDADSFIIKNLSDIVADDGHVLDWDQKIARNVEMSQKPEGGYRFSFGNGADEEFNPNESVTTVDSFKDTLETLQTEDEYQAFRHSEAQHVISARRTIVQIARGGADIPMYACDLLTSANRKYDFEPPSSDGEVFDSSVDAKLARSVPDKLQVTSGMILRNPWRMAAIITPENVGDKRGSDIIIGMINGAQGQQQLGDGSLFFSGDEEISSDQTGMLTTEALYERYHKTFSEWNCNSHQELSSELNLSVHDIASFRMWMKVSFSGKTWFVKSLTVTFNAASDRTDISGEFISVN